MKTQLKKQTYAGLFALMLVAAVMTIPHAVADEEKSKDSERKLDKPDRKEAKHDEKQRPDKQIRQTVVTGVGVGAAVDSDGALHRSHYRIDLAASSVNSTGTNSTDAYQVKKGQIFILEKGSRGTYKIIPETWRIDIGDNRSTFSAAGQIMGGKATYDVSLTGEKIRDAKNGSLYRVDGKISGNNLEYDVHYISTFAKKNRSVESILNASN
ncbi:hypothetical protein [Candidatus Nitrosotenuis sp. DW1]|uniref:hypothetical protein n=1 Tax=Candidatus Nitrosotenuis sp. DW1 TaxID=2259672 RepID=UPI0015CBE3BC|nr:hypothetical protein [Candidatus Nitrosotenuis sp. DW1]QLH09452.1 hypothetical protein DSQ19_08185 [Candidatus Nitrosotenuis sp. DW1]